MFRILINRRIFSGFLFVDEDSAKKYIAEKLNPDGRYEILPFCEE